MREKILSFILVLLLAVTAVLGFLRTKETYEIAIPGLKKIGVVKIYGEISVPTSPYGVVSKGSDRIVSQIKKLRQAGVSAVVLRINSPGGTIGACQEIVREIEHLREEKIPVVASLGDMAASGAYLVASACDKILVNPGTMTGSIGVIMGTLNWEELMKKLGVEPEIVKSGKYKDIGAFYRSMTEEERHLMQEMIDEAYGQFLEAVSKGRGISMEDLIPLAQGQVFTGKEAIKNRLADGEGNINDAIKEAKNLAGIKGEAQIIEMEPSFERFFDIFSYDVKNLFKNAAEFL